MEYIRSFLHFDGVLLDPNVPPTFCWYSPSDYKKLRSVVNSAHVGGIRQN